MSAPISVGRLDPAEWLGRVLHVVIDRPLGSLHPSGSFRYEQNYGFVPGFIAPDGEELDAYVLGPEAPVEEYVGTVVAVVLREDDVEDKLVVADGSTWTAEVIEDSIRFQERFFTSTVVTDPEADLLSVALPVPPPASFWPDVDRIALCVHRPSGSAAEFRRLVDDLKIPAGSFVVSAARHIAAGRVTLEQLQLLGRYESRSLIERNATRHVELGFFNELDRGLYAPTEAFQRASLLVLDLQARVAHDLWAESTDLAELAASAGSVVAAVVPPVPAPAFSAQRADHAVTPSSPAGQLLAFVTELRYLRSDLHAHALAEHGFFGPTARAVDRAWKGHPLGDDDVRRLQRNGLVVEGAVRWELTPRARRARDESQTATERLSTLALDAAPDVARRSLFEAMARLPGEDPRPVGDR